jgi:hypothetical protein
VNSRGPIRLGRKFTRAATGGVIIVVALLALLFMQGLGTGDGESSDAGSSANDSEVLVSADTGEVMLTADQQSGGLTDNEQAALSGKTLIVLIDEHDYRVQVSGDAPDAWQPIELSRLVEVARHATGDSNGIRVRIQKRVTARASAEQKILLELEKVGIGEDAIFESSELVD